MKKKVKKLVTGILVLTFTMSLAVPAMASQDQLQADDNTLKKTGEVSVSDYASGSVLDSEYRSSFVQYEMDKTYNRSKNQVMPDDTTSESGFYSEKTVDYGDNAGNLSNSDNANPDGIPDPKNTLSEDDSVDTGDLENVVDTSQIANTANTDQTDASNDQNDQNMQNSQNDHLAETAKPWESDITSQSLSSTVSSERSGKGEKISSDNNPTENTEKNESAKNSDSSNNSSSEDISDSKDAAEGKDQLSVKEDETSGISETTDKDADKSVDSNSAKAVKNGWVIKGKKHFYYKNNKKLTGLRTIDGSKYYFNEKGVMQKGLIKIGNKTYYFGADGKSQIGWQIIDGNKYHFSKKGVMNTGLKNIGRYTYYFNKNGIMQTGFKKIKGAYYYFSMKNGRMKKGWSTISKKRYYFDPETGIMTTGARKIDGILYYFMEGRRGKLVTNASGWKEFSGKRYYFKSDSTLYTGWLSAEEGRYYLTKKGYMKTGWLKYRGQYYYLAKDSGLMQTGWRLIGKKWYYMDAKGVRQTGWIEFDGDAYYLQSNGVMATGTVKCGTLLCVFDEDGRFTGECEYTYDPENVVIMLDAGHDDIHVGASSNGYHEEDMTLKIAQACRNELMKYKNVTVLMTREDGTCPATGTTEGGDLAVRVNLAADAGADILISLHINAAGGSQRGIMIIPGVREWKPALSDVAVELGEKMTEELNKLGFGTVGNYFRYNTREEKYPDGSDADYYTIPYVGKFRDIPAMIVEHGFIDNDDIYLLDTDADLRAVGRADARAIARFFGLKKK